MLECAFHGKQDGPYLGIPAASRQVVLSMVMVNVCQVLDGQIHRLDQYYDAGACCGN